MHESPYLVLLYYAFAEVSDPEAFAEAHRALGEQLGLRGRILIASEGINGTASGTHEACSTYMAEVKKVFPDIEFKVEPAEGHVFKALHVRVRPEIITLGAPLKAKVHERSAPRLSAREWREHMKRDDVVLLDGRNAYESEVGHFEGAICPPIDNFRDLPTWIEDHRQELQDRTILTYCTGGIRCEKLTAWMLEAGFEDVYQLDGGIVKYGQDPQTQGEGFEGINVVFDDRVAVPVGTKSKVVTRCRECGVPTANYVNCSNVECNLRMIQCPECEAMTSSSCSDACRLAPRRRLKGKKWHESRHLESTKSSHNL